MFSGGGDVVKGARMSLGKHQYHCDIRIKIQILTGLLTGTLFGS